MKICIRKEVNGSFYMDKTAVSRFTEEQLQQPPYNFSFVEINDKYADCNAEDFNEDLTFSLEKYNQRKNKIVNDKRIAEIKAQLIELNFDLLQDQAGLIVPNLNEKKAEFVSLHNELRTLLGKETRDVK